MSHNTVLHGTIPLMSGIHITWRKTPSSSSPTVFITFPIYLHLEAHLGCAAEELVQEVIFYTSSPWLATTTDSITLGLAVALGTVPTTLLIVSFLLLGLQK